MLEALHWKAVEFPADRHHEGSFGRIIRQHALLHGHSPVSSVDLTFDRLTSGLLADLSNLFIITMYENVPIYPH